jgi:hypothetical protein
MLVISWLGRLLRLISKRFLTNFHIQIQSKPARQRTAIYLTSGFTFCAR